MEFTYHPAFFAATCVSLYWIIVFIKALLITPKIGKTPNIIPKDGLGMLSRLIMLPLISCWMYYPWVAFLKNYTYQPMLAWMGVFMCYIALLLTLYCWHYMGDAWRIGIDNKEKNRLIKDGPFKQIRHPIYSLSMLLVLGSFLATQTKPMFVILCIHWVLFSFEAYREERYLAKIHGDEYLQYIQQTNRFLPSKFW